MGKATDDLRREHDVILSVLEIAEDVVKNKTHTEDAKLKFGNEFIYFLSVFTDRCHHGKEEGHLFPTMINKGFPNHDGPIGVMMQEHINGRAMVKEMRSYVDQKDLIGLVQTVAEYTVFIRNHISKENNLIFPMADKYLSSEEQDDMFANFEIFEEDVVGHGVHEQLHKMIDQWLIDYEIKD
jgi:hemerythrin-like domain-containing protein